MFNFFSQILSYFCFLVAALRPCHGRLKEEEISGQYNSNVQFFQLRMPNITIYGERHTFLLRSKEEHNQETPSHPVYFALKNETRIVRNMRDYSWTKRRQTCNTHQFPNEYCNSHTGQCLLNFCSLWMSLSM